MRNKILVLVFFFLSIQSFSQTINEFFDYEGLEILAGLAHPTNTFKYGTYELRSNQVFVNIYYDGYTTKLKITREGNFFMRMEVLEDDDFMEPFLMLEFIKEILLELIVNNEILPIIGSFEKILKQVSSDIDGSDLACLVLTLNYLNFLGKL